MQKIAASIVGAAAVGASLFALRPFRPGTVAVALPKSSPVDKGIHAGETVPCHISLERLRELGL